MRSAKEIVEASANENDRLIVFYVYLLAVTIVKSFSFNNTGPNGST
jgi:hypothetical protein